MPAARSDRARGKQLNRTIIVVLVLTTLSCAAPAEPPTIIFNSPRNAETVKGIISLDIQLSSPNRNLNDFELQIDSVIATIPQPEKMGKEHRFILELDTANLAEGEHVLKARARTKGEDAPWGEKNVKIIVDNQTLKVSLAVIPSNPRQGQVFFLKIDTNERLADLSVDFMEQKPPFYPAEEGGYVAALGARPSFAPRDYEFKIVGKAGGNPIELDGKISLENGKFIKELIEIPPAVSAKVDARTEEQKAREQEVLVNVISRFDPSLYERGFLIKPVEGKQTSPFYTTRKFSDGRSESHHGVDLAKAEGSPVYADGSGIVRLATEFIVRGKFVCIDHGRGWFSIFNHLSEISVVPGQEVEKGQEIGKVGMTGYANGPHVHWEMRVNRWIVDPRQFLTKSFMY